MCLVFSPCFYEEWLKGRRNESLRVKYLGKLVSGVGARFYSRFYIWGTGYIC